MRPIYDAKFRGAIRKRMSKTSQEAVTEISTDSRQENYDGVHIRTEICSLSQFLACTANDSFTVGE